MPSAGKVYWFYSCYIGTDKANLFMSTVDFFLQLAHCTLIEQIVVALIAYLHTGTLVVVPQVESLEVF